MFKLPPKETFLKQDGCYDHQSDLYFEAIKYCEKFTTAIDVGAHIGLFSSKMINDFQNVIAFEPAFYDYLKENVSSEKLKIYPYALSNKETTKKFYIKEHHTGMSRIDDNGDKIIHTKTLDSYNFTNVDLIKIDTENHERYVVEGMQNFLKNNQSVMIIEINDKKNKKNILSNLQSHDYKLKSQINNDLILAKES